MKRIDMATHKVKITVEIDDEEVENIMSGAMQGCGYWCDEAYVEGLAADEYNVEEALQAGKRVRIHDAEEDEWHILTLNKLLNGISLQKDFDFDDYDMYDCERVLQCALFGKEIYA